MYVKYSNKFELVDWIMFGIWLVIKEIALGRKEEGTRKIRQFIV